MRTTARILQTLAFVTIALALADTASAQYGRPINEQEKQGLWRLGFFRLTPLVQLRNAGVDTNPFLTSSVESEESEVVLRGGLQAYVPVGRRFRLRADGWLDYSFYSNALEPRALFPGGDLRAEVDVSRFTLFAGGGHFGGRQRYTTDIDTRIERTEGWINGGVQYQITIMTIPEAAVLVLHAGAMSAGSEIFVLDMGEPVRILDLARRLIELSGRSDQGDIDIVFTGLRPGEKLFEELETSDEAIAKTRHPKIYIGKIAGRSAEELSGFLGRLRSACSSGAGTLELRELLAGFLPDSELLAGARGAAPRVEPGPAAGRPGTTAPPPDALSRGLPDGARRRRAGSSQARLSRSSSPR